MSTMGSFGSIFGVGVFSHDRIFPFLFDAVLGSLSYVYFVRPFRWTDHRSWPLVGRRGNSPVMGRCIISYQEVLRSLLKNVNHRVDEAVPCNHSTNGQLLRTSVLTGRFCFGALWNFCLSLNCDSWAVEGKLFFWISLVLSSLLSAILSPSFVS